MPDAQEGRIQKTLEVPSQRPEAEPHIKLIAPLVILADLIKDWVLNPGAGDVAQVALLGPTHTESKTGLDCLQSDLINRFSLGLCPRAERLVDLAWNVLNLQIHCSIIRCGGDGL